MNKTWAVYYLDLLLVREGCNWELAEQESLDFAIQSLREDLNNGKTKQTAANNND